jgi:hypothetical protein
MVACVLTLPCCHPMFLWRRLSMTLLPFRARKFSHPSSISDMASDPSLLGTPCGNRDYICHWTSLLQLDSRTMIPLATLAVYAAIELASRLLIFTTSAQARIVSAVFPLRPSAPRMISQLACVLNGTCAEEQHGRRRCFMMPSISSSLIMIQPPPLRS